MLQLEENTIRYFEVLNILSHNLILVCLWRFIEQWTYDLYKGVLRICLNTYSIAWQNDFRWGCWNTWNQIRSDQSLSRVQLFATPWIAARQASLSIINSQSLLRLTSIKSVMPSSHLILCRPLLLLPPIPPSTRVFSNESTLRMRWPKYWSFSFSIIHGIHTYICLPDNYLNDFTTLYIFNIAFIFLF